MILRAQIFIFALLYIINQNYFNHNIRIKDSIPKY